MIPLFHLQLCVILCKTKNGFFGIPSLPKRLRDFALGYAKITAL